MQPIEYFRLTRRDVVDRHGAQGKPPQSEKVRQYREEHK